MLPRRLRQLLNGAIKRGLRWFDSTLDRSEPDSLDPSLWGLSINEDDHLVIGGCDAVDLVRRHGTPLHVVDRHQLRRNYRRLLQASGPSLRDTEVFYSYKTNPVPGVLAALHREGAGAEVISPYELWLAFKLGVPPDKIIYNGPYKPDDALERAVREEIRLININDFDEIDRIERLAKAHGKRANVGVRVATSVGVGGQFGLAARNGDALEAYKRLAAMPVMNVCGIHTHLSTRFEARYETAVREMIEVVTDVKRELGIDLRYIDMGGGFEVPTVKRMSGLEYALWSRFERTPKWPKSNDVPEVPVVVERCGNLIHDQCTKLGLREPTLIIEPGRAITSSAQILLLSVSHVKQRHDGKKYAILDGGANIALPVLFEYHRIFVANRMSSEDEETYRVVGRICDPNDMLYPFQRFPRLAKDDAIAIMDSGAYFIPTSREFSFPLPAVVMASEGNAQLIRRRQTHEDMVARDEAWIDGVTEERVEGGDHRPADE